MVLEIRTHPIFNTKIIVLKIIVLKIVIARGRPTARKFRKLASRCSMIQIVQMLSQKDFKCSKTSSNI